MCRILLATPAAGAGLAWSPSPAMIAVLGILALAFVNGLTVGSDARPGPGAFRRSVVALALSLIAGIAFALVSGAGVGLAGQPCPYHGYCLRLPTATVILGAGILALPAALWLGLASWLGLGLGLTLRRHTWQAA